MNTVTIAGRLGRDPESRTTPSGQKVTTFPLATNVYRGGQEETIWWRITVWGDRLDRMMQYLTKGKGVIVVGQLSRAPEIWNDNSGQARVSSLEVTADSIHFNPFGTKNDEQQQTGQGAQQQQQTGYQKPAQQQQAPQQTYNAPQQPASAPQQPQQQQSSPLGYGGGASSGEEGDPLPF